MISKFESQAGLLISASIILNDFFFLRLLDRDTTFDTIMFLYVISTKFCYF